MQPLNRLFLVILLAFLNFYSHAFANDIQHNNNAVIFSLTDIHFDPFTACNEKPPCPLIQKLKAAPVSAWHKLLVTYDVKAVKYGFDTNYPLLASTLLVTKKMADEKNPQFVLLLGDLLGHQYREKYKKYTQDKSRSGYRFFVIKTFQFLANEINQAFSVTDVYALLGNNDTYSNDYYSQPNGQFFQDIAPIYAHLIKNKNNSIQLQQQFRPGGYYAVDILKGKLRLIMLNSVLFSNKSNEKEVAQAANKELEWLHKQLQFTKLHNQKAIIAMHIPPSVDIYATARLRLFTLLELWRSDYLARFVADLQTFAPNIMAIFASHLHSDWFQILTFGNTNNEIPMIGVSSISPIFGNNPGFKLNNYSPKNLELGDFQIYYYLLDKREWVFDFRENKLDSSVCHKCPTVWHKAFTSA